MHKKLYFIFAFFLCFFLVEAIAASDVKVQVAQARDRWLTAFKSKNVDQAISYYASDAAFLQPTGDRIEGIAVIRELYKKVASTFDSDLLVRSHNLEVSADLAFDSGEYEEILTDRATAQKQHFRGQYVMVPIEQRWAVEDYSTRLDCCTQSGLTNSLSQPLAVALKG